VSRSFALRLLETFFRRWLLCLLPALLLITVGIESTVTAKNTYVSKGVLYVESETLLSKLTGTGPATNNGYLTPAQDASTRLNSLIGTDEFIHSIVDRAGLTDLVNSGVLTIDQVRSSVGTTPSSPNTLQVGSSNVDPQVAFRLATATIDSFIQWVIDANLSDSTTAEQFLQQLADTYETDVQTTQAALNKFLASHVEPPIGVARPAADQIQLSQLQSDFNAAQSRYTGTLSKAEDARLASAQTRSNVAGRLRLVDKPTVSSASTLTKKKIVLRFALFLALGLALSAVAVFVGTVTDKSFRSPEEIRQRLGVPLLAVVPESRRPGRRRRHDPKVDAPPNERSRPNLHVDESAPAGDSRTLEGHHAAF
jgi:hypothetical protein